MGSTLTHDHNEVAEMTIGVGGSSAERELAAIAPLRDGVRPIEDQERLARIDKARRLMRAQDIGALYLDASTSLYYFTGLQLTGSERLHGALISQDHGPVYICPAFEESRIRGMISIGDDIRTWEEHEDPGALVIDTLRALDCTKRIVAIDEATPFFTYDRIRCAGPDYRFINASVVTGACRMIKSEAEIALMQKAKDITLEIHKTTARILCEGISTTEVARFIADAHRRAGVDGDLSFCIVLFGEATAYPHGVPWSQLLNEGDMVLIDTGARVEGYHSDITRSYVYGEPDRRQRQIWNLEKTAQAAAFEAAQPGVACAEVDAAARRVIEAGGLGPGYRLPGLPHRTGHGIGLDVHEWSYLVAGNQTPLAPGMCFSNEPMICLPGEFGVRLEDHFRVTDTGPRWFTEPSRSIDDPFGLDV